LNSSITRRPAVACLLQRFFKTRMAVSASAHRKQNRSRAVRARRPRHRARLMPASASARLIFVPSPPGRDLHAHGMQAIGCSETTRLGSAFLFAPLMGARKTTRAGFVGARREMRNSKFAPASLKALNLSASPPGRSAISPAHTSTFLSYTPCLHLLENSLHFGSYINKNRSLRRQTLPK
jgi:hypothetical protein